MALGTTVRDSNLYKDVLIEAIAAKFSTQMALAGSGVARLIPNLPTMTVIGGKPGTGSHIEVPYFNSLGELEDIPEGGALTPRKLTSSKEIGTYVHSGLAGEVTAWAQLAAQAGDPYVEFARQYVEASMRRIDSGLITKALASSLVQDHSGVSIIEDHIINASEQWGDQLNDADGIRLIVCHSKVRAAMRKLKDGETAVTGRRLYTDAIIGPNREVIALPTFAGIPVMCSDRLTPAAAGYAANVYPTLVCKRDAMVAWYNGDPVPETDRDILADSDVTAIHMYHVEHLYRAATVDGIKPGVVVLKTLQV